MTYYTDLQRAYDAQAAQIAAQQAEIARLRAENKILADAVLTYGIHDLECPRYDGPRAEPCTCGFSAAIDAAYAVTVQP